MSPTMPRSVALPRDFTQERCPAIQASGHFSAYATRPAIGIGSYGILHGGLAHNPS
jgi:hypothetical protein